MSIKVRAAIRTAGMLVAIALGMGTVYAFAVLGMLPGVIILCAIGLVFIMYDTNKSQIQYEDKLDEMVKKYKE
jgi:hypothetical protein